MLIVLGHGFSSFFFAILFIVEWISHCAKSQVFQATFYSLRLGYHCWLLSALSYVWPVPLGCHWADQLRSGSADCHRWCRSVCELMLASIWWGTTSVGHQDTEACTTKHCTEKQENRHRFHRQPSHTVIGAWSLPCCLSLVCQHHGYMTM